MTPSRRIKTFAACTALLTASAAAAAATPAVAADPDPLDRFATQKVTWHECTLGAGDELGQQLDAAGADCADLTVPLDYADPGGRTITVAISRMKATDTAHYAGPLLLNDGGPAGPSMHMVITKSEAMGDAAGRFDLIGMDPRFVGRSTPLDCGWDHGTAFLRSAGADRAAYRTEVVVAREMAEQCQRTNGDVLPHVTTRNTARDMDVIRAALGARSLHYLGGSYGSYLGEVYSQLFPGRTGRMVLDSVNHPDGYRPNLLRGAEAANEEALRAWASWAAARNDSYGLGATRGQVLATVAHTLRAAEQQPLRIGSTYRLDEHVLPALFIAGLGSDLDVRRAALAETAAILARAADREPVEPSELLAGQLAFLLTEAGSATASQMTAIICGDVAERHGVGSYWRAVERSRDRFPLAGPLANNITPCEFWARPAEEPTELDNDVPALLVNSTGDPRTVYAGAQAMREQWPSGRLITLEGARQHDVYGVYGNACVDQAVNAYLRTGRLPARDLTCAA